MLSALSCGLNCGRRSTICRTLALVITVSLCFLILGEASTKNSAQAGLDLHEREHDHLHYEQAPLDVGPTQSAKTSRAAAPTSAPKHNDDSKDDFMARFKATMVLMPAELTKNSLLGPFTTNGEDHLYDLALRVREFRPIYKAWEKLHFVVEGGRLGTRNVLQTLRSKSKDAATSMHSYEAFRFFLDQLNARLFPGVVNTVRDLMALHSSFYDGGRGIVLTVGNGQVPYVITSIQGFRKLGCELPIEIMYLGDDDLGEDSRNMLESLPGVVTRNMKTMINDEGWSLGGWAAKPWAILMSSFREALFLDADVLFFANPEIMFDDPSYEETGALFFRDRNLGREKKRQWIRKVLPKPISKQVQEVRMWTGESGHVQDSGLLVINKWRHFVSLLLTARLNGIDRDGNSAYGTRGVYDMVYGDKETFWLSWEMAGVSDYAFHAGATGIIGRLNSSVPMTESIDSDASDDEIAATLSHRLEHVPLDPITGVPRSYPQNYTVCSPQLLHYDIDGKPLWLNGWLSADKFAHANELDANAFQVHIKEPNVKDKGVEPWQLKENNNCCLTADSVEKVTMGDKEILEMLIDIAKKVEWDIP